MRFYTAQHRFYAGIDLHARTMHLCVLDHTGTVVCDRYPSTFSDLHFFLEQGLPPLIDPRHAA